MGVIYMYTNQDQTMNYKKIATEMIDMSRRTGERALFYTWWGEFVHAPHNIGQRGRETNFDKFMAEHDLVGYYNSSANPDWVVDDMIEEQNRLKRFTIPKLGDENEPGKSTV